MRNNPLLNLQIFLRHLLDVLSNLIYSSSESFVHLLVPSAGYLHFSVINMYCLFDLPLYLLSLLPQMIQLLVQIVPHVQQILHLDHLASQIINLQPQIFNLFIYFPLQMSGIRTHIHSFSLLLQLVYINRIDQSFQHVLGRDNLQLFFSDDGQMYILVMFVVLSAVMFLVLVVVEFVVLVRDAVFGAICLCLHIMFYNVIQNVWVDNSLMILPSRQDNLGLMNDLRQLIHDHNPDTFWTCLAKSIIRFEYPHSLSYQETTLWKFLLRERPANLSQTDEWGSCRMSEETIYYYVQPSTPFRFPQADLLTASEIQSYVAGFQVLKVKSTTETLIVGTLNDIPVTFPFKLGITFPNAFAAPVEYGTMLDPVALPPRQLAPFLTAESTTA